MRRSRSGKKKQKNGVDKQLLFVVLSLTIFGIAMVFDASAPDAVRAFGDKFFFVKRQVIWATIGLGFLFVFANIRYSLLAKYALAFFGVCILLLILVLIPGLGITALGASRRIDIGPVGIQPSEIAKLALAVFLASSFAKEVNLVRFLIPTGVVTLLILLEPDLGTTVIVAVMAFAMYFVAGGKILHVFLVSVTGFLAGLIFALSSEYRRERILTFLNPESDPLNTSYHVRQILIALGSGGLFGLGLGESRQKHLFLPEPATDSIFAIIGEEFGFIGAFFLILVFMFLLWRGFSIAFKTEDLFGRLLAVGITSWFGIQIVVNLSAMVALVPLTGIPLPFISYGGSSLVISLAAVGVLLSISRNYE